ncbi:MAG: peptidoglycan DD-metalloendopeptidase family protein [bacterium]|nr:peptidoglycan DD-metalloendopeptidase family protein [bacterium]
MHNPFFNRFAALLLLTFTLGMGFLEVEASSTIPPLDSNPTRRFPVPLLFGLAPARITDSWGEARPPSRSFGEASPDGRAHEGIDIVAPRGTFILSPTDALITSVGYDDLGGNYVLSANPGGEQFYYAHLEDVAPDVVPGKMLRRGDLIGYVGNTGNARRSLPHLHFGIYYKGVATNPYPRLTRGFSLEESIAILETIAGDPDVPFSVISRAINTYKDFLGRAQDAGFTFPHIVAWVFTNTDILAKAREFQGAIIPGSEHDGVRLLQEFLIRESAGPAAQALAETGATGYFGALTQNALMEYQVANGIVPAEGYFDPLTKTRVLDALSRDVSRKTMPQAPEGMDVPEIGSDNDVTSLFRQFLGGARDYLLFTQVLPDREGA